MGMFQSPYDRGGVLSKEAVAERKKIYRDRRSPEIRKKENISHIVYFLPLLRLMLLLPDSLSYDSLRDGSGGGCSYNGEFLLLSLSFQRRKSPERGRILCGRGYRRANLQEIFSKPAGKSGGVLYSRSRIFTYRNSLSTACKRGKKLRFRVLHSIHSTELYCVFPFFLDKTSSCNL